MVAVDQKEKDTMTVSSPMPEVASGNDVARAPADRAEHPSLVARAGQLFKRAYSRACSAVFDSPEDCMRL
jgi:hypothetical protein